MYFGEIGVRWGTSPIQFCCKFSWEQQFSLQIRKEREKGDQKERKGKIKKKEGERGLQKGVMGLERSCVCVTPRNFPSSFLYWFRGEIKRRRGGGGGDKCDPTRLPGLTNHAHSVRAWQYGMGRIFCISTFYFTSSLTLLPYYKLSPLVCVCVCVGCPSGMVLSIRTGSVVVAQIGCKVPNLEKWDG